MDTNIFYYLKNENLDNLSTKIENLENINIQDESGNTILHYLSEIKNDIALDLLEKALKKGADPLIFNDKKELPINICLNNNNKKGLIIIQYYQ